MNRKRIISLLLAIAMVFTMFTGNVTASVGESTTYKTFNFKSGDVSGAINLNDGNVPIYNSSIGYGFVGETSYMPSRMLSTGNIKWSAGGFNITEDGTGSYINYTNNNHYNYGGLVFRIDVDTAGAYGITVNLSGCTSSNVNVAPNGMKADRITGSSYWDSAKKVKIQNYAKWVDADTWQYDFVTGEKYIEIEVEPKTQPKSGNSIDVGIESIELNKIGNNVRQADELPTVYVLGDSTEKTYTFEEAGMSGWGQIIEQMFDLSKVNVINYSMGGRSMKAMYFENRFNDVLMTANEGDYVFLHSAHNDESTGASEGAEARFGRGSTTATYTAWLNNIYIPALRARGICPVLVTAMPRTNNGTPNSGFNPNSPEIMKEAADNNADVECIDLYENAKKYIADMGTAQTIAIYMSVEAGETPGKTNSGSYANGHPDDKIDGTHYKEAASKVWSKIIAEQIYTQSKVGGCSAKMKELAQYLDKDVRAAAETGDWSKVFPEWANDVSLISTGDGSYYRNQIEKMLELGVMFKDNNSNFNPSESMKTNEFISALCALWGLDLEESSINAVFEPYYTSGTITREQMAAIVLGAYELRFGYDKDGNLNKPVYMTNYNGNTITPDDPNYDPNLTGKEAQYYPLVGWGNLTDKSEISLEYAEDFYNVYNLGLMRSENGIARGQMKNGTLLEPKTEVSRAKAAKELWFLWVLGQNNVLEENHVSTIYNKDGNVQNIAYKAVNYTAKAYEFDSVNIDSTGVLDVKLNVNSYNNNAKLKAEVYGADGGSKSSAEFTIDQNGEVSGMNIILSKGEYVNLQVVDGSNTLSGLRKVVCTELITPVRSYTATTVAGIKNGTLELTNITDGTGNLSELSAFSVTTDEDGTMWWKASENVEQGVEVMENLAPTYEMAYTALKVSIGDTSFDGYVAHSSKNGYVDGSGSGFKFTPAEDGVLTAYVSNLGATKDFIIVEAGSPATAALASSMELGLSGNCSINATLKAGSTYYITVLGSKGRFLGISYSAGAPVVSTLAKAGETVEIKATPDSGYKVDSITVTDDNNNVIAVNCNDSKTISTFVMPESNVSISAKFIVGSDPVVPDTSSTTVESTETTTEITTVSTTETSTETTTEVPVEAIHSVKANMAGSNGIMFVSAVDSLNYIEVGFKLEANGKSVRRSMQTVYNSIDGSNYSLADIGGNYMFAFTVSDIDTSEFGTNIKVTPYAITKKGIELKGETVEYSVDSLSANTNPKGMSDSVISDTAIVIDIKEDSDYQSIDMINEEVYI